jgi:hypothetical protein
MPKPLVLFLDFDELAYAVLETSKFLLTHIYQENKVPYYRGGFNRTSLCSTILEV